MTPKQEHLAEATINTMSGFLLSLVLMQVLRIAFGREDAGWDESAWMVLAFTILSIGRNYFWRRFFHKSFHKRTTTKMGHDNNDDK